MTKSPYSCIRLEENLIILIVFCLSEVGVNSLMHDWEVNGWKFLMAIWQNWSTFKVNLKGLREILLIPLILFLEIYSKYMLLRQKKLHVQGCVRYIICIHWKPKSAQVSGSSEWFNLFVLFHGIEYSGLEFWAYVCTQMRTCIYTPILKEIFLRKKKEIKPSYRTVYIVSSLG